ncbi:class II histone deacetylase [Nocardioides sp. NPDC023903]|uniref:class II histone deacetylase n=1 Tax=Nocardioides sp. NPDC023903 TaxID=3157195 RepID=UPI0033DCE87E
MITGFVWLERYSWHDTGNYSGSQPLPNSESPASKARLASLVEVSGVGEHLERLSVRPASKNDLLRVHTEHHVSKMEELSRRPEGGDAGDGLSPFGRGSYDIARYSAGGTIAAVEAVLTGRCANAYALVRPPGHHALPDQGMGYCMFANIPIAVEYAREAHGIERVAIVDWDVHHGNGTQDIYYDDPAVLTLSVHQDGLFPADSGGLDELGVGAGSGANLNVPLPPGSGNGAYVEVFDKVVVPALRRFRPELIMVASGFDASVSDPHGRMMVTSSGFRQLTRALLEEAENLCGGRLVFSHEGGYSSEYVPFCGLAMIEALSGRSTGIHHPYAAYHDRLPGQDCTETQASAIAAAARNLELVPRN